MTLTIGIDGRYLNDHYPGIGRYLFNLLRALPQVMDESEQCYALLDPNGLNTRFQLAELCKAGIQPITTTLPLRSLREQITLRREAQRLGLTLFHTPYFITAYRQVCPLVITVHDAIAARYPRLLPSWPHRFAFRLAMHAAVYSARFILTPSLSARRDLIELFGVPRERIVVTPEAVDSHFRPINAETITALRTRLNLPTPYVLYLGGNKPHKNLVRLIEAWAKLRTSGVHSYHLLIAGYWDSRYPQAQQRIQQLQLDDVQILGPVTEADLPALYSGAELFVFPSLYEGFGLPVLEAMACATPVACSATSSLLDVAGKAAAFFEPLKVESITATLACLLRDPLYRARLAQQGLQQAATFSWQQTARLTLDVYRQAVGMEL